MNKKILCRVILAPVTESEDGVMEGGFASFDGAEFVGELQPRNGSCLNKECMNPNCRNIYCLNPDCLNPDCPNGSCLNPNCLNAGCENGNCTTPTSTSTATGTSRKIGSCVIDGLI